MTDGKQAVVRARFSASQSSLCEALCAQRFGVIISFFGANDRRGLLIYLAFIFPAVYLASFEGKK
jgi:hypothetical protein